MLSVMPIIASLGVTVACGVHATAMGHTVFTASTVSMQIPTFVLYLLACWNVLSNEKAKVTMLQELFAAKDAMLMLKEKKARQVAETKLNTEQQVVGYLCKS